MNTDALSLRTHLCTTLSSANALSCLPSTSWKAASLFFMSRILLCWLLMRCSCVTTSRVMATLEASAAEAKEDSWPSSWARRGRTRVRCLQGE